MSLGQALYDAALGDNAVVLVHAMMLLITLLLENGALTPAEGDEIFENLVFSLAVCIGNRDIGVAIIIVDFLHTPAGTLLMELYAYELRDDTADFNGCLIDFITFWAVEAGHDVAVVINAHPIFFGRSILSNGVWVPQ